jgi:hypothetical protein
MRVYVVRKWPLRERSRFVCWNITRLNLWLLRNVHFVRSTKRTGLETRTFVRSINNLMKLGVCASRNQTVKNIDAPMLTRVWQELEYRIDVCRVNRGAHIEYL